MKYKFKPESLKGPYDDDAEYQFLVQRAYECLAFRMSPEYWDNMTTLEHNAWIEALKKIEEERNG